MPIILSESEVTVGGKGYIDYATGVAMLANPQRLEHVHGRDIEQEPHVIVVTAKELMYHGLRGLIASASESAGPRGGLDRKIPLEDKAESQFGDTAPVLEAIVNVVYEKKLDRLKRLNPGFEDVQPMPFMDEALYKALCHPRREKLQTRRLMEPFLIARCLEDIVPPSDTIADKNEAPRAAVTDIRARTRSSR